MLFKYFNIHHAIGYITQSQFQRNVIIVHVFVQYLLLSFQLKCSSNIDSIHYLGLTNSFDRKLINFLLLLNEPIRVRFRTDLPIGNAQEVKINLNSYELVSPR
jgi:hypothetical protein